MTQFTDPVRWTASGADAPEGLREMFAAGRSEGPNGAQMRALSIKLAAAVASGAGAAAVGGAVKPLASAMGGGTVKSAFAGAKLLAAMTVAGAVTLGGAVAYRSTSTTPTFRSGAAVTGVSTVVEAPVAAPAAARAAARIEAPTPSVAPYVSPTQRVPSESAFADGLSAAPADRVQRGVMNLGSEAAARSASRVRAERLGNQVGRPQAVAQSGAAHSASAQAPIAGSAAPATELGLLRQAQAALVTRPREAFALTQQHRAAFPRGQFAEERDALAIQALLRSGERDEAIDLAERFVAAHPNSAHAHKVRELLKAN